MENRSSVLDRYYQLWPRGLALSQVSELTWPHCRGYHHLRQQVSPTFAAHCRVGPTHPPHSGTKVPRTNYQLNPIQEAFNIGTFICWLDFNDCFLATECKCIIYALS